jgi:hypothetical protein
MPQNNLTERILALEIAKIYVKHQVLDPDLAIILNTVIHELLAQLRDHEDAEELKRLEEAANDVG